jgi:subtilase family serine protease
MNRRAPARAERCADFIELLESRTLLSASTPARTVHFDSHVLKYAASAASIQGYTPAQIRHAYGFDQVSGNGQGQTIAIVDAYNAPTIVNDLTVFDQQFGLSAPPSFSVMNQSGGSSLPSTDAGWAGEISLDVQWAHAIAPMANIVLVEANSSSIEDLIAAVKTARSIPGVSTVSMSWGGSEFESFNGAEFQNQTALDKYFTTPSGHQGITFIAAAGDTGVYQGAQWPATSPNVLSVGGTSLYTTNQAGSYSTEFSWSGTSGGFSLYENQPAYQSVAAAGAGVRVSPDVAYDADPNTGFAVYDSTPDQGFSGWQEVGGTSAGAPQWAGLIAIADQTRAAAGKGTLDGATGTLPTLYNLYSAPGTAGYSNYTSYFNDVIGSGGFRGGATAGYDIFTGLGTPKAAAIISALAGNAGSGGGSGGTIGGGGGVGTGGGGAAQMAPSPITGAILTAPPATIVGGTAGSIKVLLTNTSATNFSGPLSISLYASAQTSLSSNATGIVTFELPQLKLKAGASVTETVKFTYPSGMPNGNYYLIASTNATYTNTIPSTSTAATPVDIEAPRVDLAAYFAGGLPVAVKPGHSSTASIVVQNMGNVTATGSFSLALYASLGEVLDPSDTLLATLLLKKISLAPGQSMTLRVRFRAPSNMAAGTYHLIAATYGATQPADSNLANNVAVTATTA